MKLQHLYNSLCTPAKVYLIIALFASICGLFQRNMLMMVCIKLIFAVIWTCVLEWLCKKGYSEISWFLVLLPYIILILAIFHIYKTNSSEKNIMRSLKLQGLFGREPFSNSKSKSASKSK